MSRFLRVLIVILSILLPGYLYLGFSLVESFLGWILLSLPFLLILSFPFRWRKTESEDEDPGTSRSVLLVLHLTYLSMGLLSNLLVLTILSDVYSWLGDRDISPDIILFLAVVALVIGTLKASWGLRIKKVLVNIPGLPIEFAGFKIAQISDLHIGPTIGEVYVGKVVNLVNSISPDIVVLTGDIGDTPVKDVREPIKILGKMKCQHGMFFSPGNHEYYWDLHSWVSALRAAGIQPLLNSGEVIQKGERRLLIAGITDPAAAMASLPAPNLQKAQEKAASADLKILLSHRPDFAEAASKLGFHLQLSGHTHGGQFFPWTLVVRLIHKYHSGLHRVGNSMWIYVNSGTGSWGPLLRLGTVPEVTEIELQGS